MTPSVLEGPGIHVQPSIDAISLGDSTQSQAFKRHVPSMKAKLLRTIGHIFEITRHLKTTLLYRRGLQSGGTGVANAFPVPTERTHTAICPTIILIQFSMI